jgi:virginiamycin B lyase
VASDGAGPYGVTTGPDGALWLTLVHSGQISRIGPDDEVTTHTLDAAGCGPSVISGPFGIATGPDGALWFTEMTTDTIGQIGDSDVTTEFALPVRGGFPSMITAGPDEALWFTLNQARCRAVRPDRTIVADPAGCCWFTEWAANRIGHISPDGAFRHHDLPTPASEPHGITVALDGTVWTAQETGTAAQLTSTFPDRPES